MKAMIDHEHVVNVGDRFGEHADDLDRFFDRGPFEHRGVLGLHQPARRIRRIFQQLLDPRGHRRRQLFEHRLRALVGNGFQDVGGIVGIQLLDDAAQQVGRERLENLGADGRREPRQDGRGRRCVEEGEDFPPGLGVAGRVQHLGDVRRMERRNHRPDGVRLCRLQESDESLESLFVCRHNVRFLRAHEENLADEIARTVALFIR